MGSPDFGVVRPYVPPAIVSQERRSDEDLSANGRSGGDTPRLAVGTRQCGYARGVRQVQLRISTMKMPITMMLTSQLLLPIQSRTFGMATCARLRNSR